MTSKCGRNKEVAREAQLRVSLTFLQNHGDMEPTCTFYGLKRHIVVNGDVIYASFLQEIIS